MSSYFTFIKSNIWIFSILLGSAFSIINKTKTVEKRNEMQFWNDPMSTNTNNSLMEWVMKMDLLNETTGHATMMYDVLHYDLIKKNKNEIRGRAAVPNSLTPTTCDIHRSAPSEICLGIAYEITLAQSGRRLCMDLNKRGLEQIEWLYEDESSEDNCRFMFVKLDEKPYPYLVSLSPSKNNNGFLPIINIDGKEDTAAAYYHIAFNPTRCRVWNSDHTLTECPDNLGTGAIIGRRWINYGVKDGYFIEMDYGALYPYQNRIQTVLGDNPEYHEDYGHLASEVTNYQDKDGEYDIHGTDPWAWGTVAIDIAPNVVFEVVDMEYDTSGINMDSRKNVLYAKTETIINLSDATITSTYKDKLVTESSSTWSTGLATSLGISFEFTKKVPGVFEAKVEISVEGSYNYKDEWSGSSKKTWIVEETVEVKPHSSVEIFSVLQRLDAKPIPFKAKLRGSVYCSRFDTKTRKVVRAKAPSKIIDKTLDSYDPNWRTNLNVTKMMDDEFEMTIYGEYVSDVVVDVKMDLKDIPLPSSEKGGILEEDVADNTSTTDTQEEGANPEET